MAYFVKNIQKSGDLFKNQYTGIDLKSLANEVNSILTKQGYKINTGAIGNAEYEKGNRVLRILFGAFVKYFKFTVTLKQLDESNIELTFIKSSTGMSGGLIGMGQVSRELTRLFQVFSAL